MFHLKSPAPGEVVVFRDPAGQDRYAVKRCIGLPGVRIKIVNKQVLVNNTPVAPPAAADRGGGFTIDGRYSPRDNMPEFSVPKKGDDVDLEQLGLFEFDFYASLIRQENPETRLSETADLTVGGKADNTVDLSDFQSEDRRKDGSLNFDAMNWLELRNVLNFLEARRDSLNYGFRRTLYKDGVKLRKYTVKSDAYFLMGDNWDESMDGRFTGFVSESRIEARVSFIFWSRGEDGIRWYRMLLFV
jgi:signal peptidase I